MMYSIYKHEFSRETYLDFISNRNIRTALSRFRLSSHDLAIESGRYDDTPRSDRLCKFCNLNVVENKYHFLLVCPLCIDIRRKYFNSYFCHWPTLMKIENLLSVKSKRKINNLAKYVYFASQLRTATKLEKNFRLSICNIFYYVTYFCSLQKKCLCISCSHYKLFVYVGYKHCK